nr:MAG TPA: hypothetical protein [Caudoviricetes sp.]
MQLCNINCILTGCVMYINFGSDQKFVKFC